MALIQLIFESSLIRIDESNLTEIFKAGRRHNMNNHITGVVILSGANCIEVLEGERELVSQTYERIVQDRRHSITCRGKERSIDQRTFHRWTTGYRIPNRGRGNGLTLADCYFFDGTDSTFIREGPSVAMKALQNFRDRTLGQSE